MTNAADKNFGTVGALAAFPRRLAAREVERQGGFLTRGVTRRTSHIVFGRLLLAKAIDSEIEVRVDELRKAGRHLLSENGFLRLLGLAKVPEASTLPAQSLLDQSRLDKKAFELLSLFDAFEHDGEPYSFRDLILARKYSGLIAGGASWGAIARSIHRSGPLASLTAKSLQVEGFDTICARHDENLSELNGQLLLNIATPNDAALEEMFAEAEASEEEARYDDAAALYQRCMAIDPTDAVIAFNRANCLRADGRKAEAAHDYARALKLEPSFAEAWFNLACLMTDNGHPGSARRHLRQAIALDRDYADAKTRVRGAQSRGGASTMVALLGTR